MDIILATRNLSKAQQIRAILGGLPHRILTLDEAGVKGEAIEDGATLSENATKKAHFAWESTGRKNYCVADDTGLFIDALNGRPGIHSARWAGEEATTAQILRFTLRQLRDVPTEKRSATFNTVAVVIRPRGTSVVFTGEVTGTLLTEALADFQPNMPYSGIFVPDGQSKVWAQMSVEEENEISHRGMAFRKVLRYFEKI